MIADCGTDWMVADGRLTDWISLCVLTSWGSTDAMAPTAGIGSQAGHEKIIWANGRTYPEQPLLTRRDVP